uniref:Chromo domain-containing protein n=1 Tax=Heterorhabditis bacteriophora TaxID=37862 RepID=A0A1I7XD22_HETBA
MAEVDHDQDDITMDEPAEDDSLLTNDDPEDGDVAEGMEEDQEGDEGEKKKGKRGRGRKAKGSSKRKADYPDPSSSNSTEMCLALDLVDVTIKYTEEDYNTITNLKDIICYISRAAARVDKKKIALEKAQASRKAKKEKGDDDEGTGSLLCCDTCPSSFHAYCLNPPLVEFFIKWRYMSYWHCEWVSETLMDVYFVHRIINHMQYGKTQFDYLVKWKELVYEQATWERDDMDIAYYEDAIIKYWIHR